MKAISIDRLQARIDAQSPAPSVRFMAHLPEVVHHTLKRMAKRQGISMNSLIVNMLEVWLEEFDAETLRPQVIRTISINVAEEE